MKFRGIIYFFLLSVLLAACGDDQTQFERDVEKIQDFLSANNISATQHPSGIFYLIEEEGTGGGPNQFATVIVKYQGRLLDGTVFDETKGDKTAQFNLNGTVRGFQVAVTLLQRNGKGTFYIPSGLGYGRFDQGDIPGNSVLIFDIELVDFIN